MIKIYNILLVLCILIQSTNTLIQGFMTSKFICEDNRNIVAYKYLISKHYFITIYEHLEANTNITAVFDSEGAIFINIGRNVSKFTSEPDLINNVFNFEILKNVRSLVFEVVGRVAPQHPPYLISLKINGEEKCTKPIRVGFNIPNGPKKLEDYWPAAPDKFCGRRRIYKKHTELIMGGSATKSGFWPWHVAIYGWQNNTLQYRCGGTLLSTLFVLTAAHCVTLNGEPLSPQSISAVLGKFSLASTEITTQNKEIFRIIVHEGFVSRKLNNDIALLKLNSEANINNYVQPACLWLDDIYDQLDSYEVMGTVVGWGFDQMASTTSDLHEITIPLVPESQCIRYDAVFYSYMLNGNKFCAGYNNGTAACNGDSGGGFLVFVPDARIPSYSYPLQKRPGAWYIKGIVSTTLALEGASICDPRAYTVFTDVAKYRDWILNNLQS